MTLAEKQLTSRQIPTGMQVAVSTVILSMRHDSSHDSNGHDSKTANQTAGASLWLPLVRRINDPFEGLWALPGGLVGLEESLSQAAARTLGNTTGLRPSYLEQLYTFGHPDRSPSSRVISVVYNALVREDEASQAFKTENVRWFCVNDIPQLAFDHNEIVDYALWRLRNKVEYAHVAFYFLNETFSLSQLREVYECILQRKLDPANFRRRVEATGTIIPTDQRLTGGRHRPPRLYRVNPDIFPIAQFTNGPINSGSRS